jgi:hypothetical protein
MASIIMSQMMILVTTPDSSEIVLTIQPRYLPAEQLGYAVYLDAVMMAKLTSVRF